MFPFTNKLCCCRGEIYWQGTAVHDTIAELAKCETPRETEAFIKVIDMHRLLNSKVKAQHFAHFCSTRLELPVLSVNTLARSSCRCRSTRQSLMSLRASGTASVPKGTWRVYS
ncbi:hypothetical protein GQ600_25739 [Phytophthora cactorum]|nr:hypothetical protein GQ600_25739 [Phytophthora cactorum]